MLPEKPTVLSSRLVELGRTKAIKNLWGMNREYEVSVHGPGFWGCLICIRKNSMCLL